jgi:hypothetical protein
MLLDAHHHRRKPVAATSGKYLIFAARAALPQRLRRSVIRRLSTYKNTEASPKTASVGADPRYPADPTVSIANAVQLMNFGAGRRAAGWTGRGGL